MVTELFKKIAHSMPGLPIKLRLAGMDIKPEEFIRKTFFSTFYMTTGILLIIAGFFSRQDIVLKLVAILAPIVFVTMFLYMLRLPDVKALRRTHEINREVIDAGRYLIVEIDSGISLYEALRGISKNFQYIGKYFKELIDDIDTGTSIEEALNESIEFSPSQDLRRILWQILNSLKTGSDIAQSLKEVIEQISREHLIEVRRYGRKLNPLAMFYMMVAVIMPSLGITMLVVLSSFVAVQLDLTVLIVIALAFGFLQFIFLAIVKSARPAVNM